MGFKLKGNAGSSTRQVRTIKFKVRVLQLKQEGATAKEALAQACEESKTELAPAMIDHPASIFHGYRTAVSKKIDNGDQETLDLLIAANMVEETDDEQVEVVSDLEE